MTILVPLPIHVSFAFLHDISVAATWNLDCDFFYMKKISFFEVSRPLRSPTFYACMVRLWNDLNI